MMRRRTFVGAAGAALVAAPALAQSYPDKSIKMVVPYPPGGGTDGLGRITAQFLSEKLGQPIVVHNIGGASSTVGSDTVRRAEPDGYTLLFNASLFVLGKTVVPTCPYDPVTDFRAIAQAGEAPLVLLVNPKVPGTDYASTMAAIGKEPKKYFFALSSGGSAGHIATLAFLKRTGLPLDTILYKGTAPANADLVAGNVQLFMDPWTALLPLATSGRARGLFVTSKERTKLAPDIPTSDQVGLKDFNISSWYGVWAPKDTPEPVVDKLAAAMAQVSRDPGFIEKTTSLGIVPTARGPKDFAAFIKGEVEANTALLRESGFKPE
ncbi:Bug family tripartite tricarboxylate transporter substrate binding protein [Reyranella sp.]|uniref:Bug family tripartite tricarboxylate transporter substrate binding protein n=1 Tax=Reyranella sp. TaxID=1929291 RepID=UPI003BAA76FE